MPRLPDRAMPTWLLLVLPFVLVLVVVGILIVVNEPDLKPDAGKSTTAPSTTQSVEQVQEKSDVHMAISAFVSDRWSYGPDDTTETRKARASKHVVSPNTFEWQSDLIVIKGVRAEAVLGAGSPDQDETFPDMYQVTIQITDYKMPDETRLNSYTVTQTLVMQNVEGRWMVAAEEMKSP